VLCGVVEVGKAPGVVEAEQGIGDPLEEANGWVDGPPCTVRRRRWNGATLPA
jgi:hypothetical protein